MSSDESGKKFWIKIGAAAALLLGVMYYVRKRSSASSSSSSQSSKGPDGNPIIKGLVFYPTESYWGARPITQWTSTSSCRIVVPINHRKTDALAAVAVVAENVRCGTANGRSCSAPASSSSSSVASSEKDIILDILRQRNSSAASAGSDHLVESYDLESLTSASVSPATVGGISKKNNKNERKHIFSFTVKGAGGLASGGASQLFVFVKYIAETDSLVELVIDHSVVIDENDVTELAKNVYLTPVVAAQTASLVSTIPSSALRLVVPCSKWNFVANSRDNTEKRIVSVDDDKIFLPLDDDSNANSQEATSVQARMQQLRLTAPSALITSASNMSDNELLASPKLITSVVHKRLGVEFPAVPNAKIVEPRYAATDSLACVLASSSSLSSSLSKSCSNLVLSFEVWTDAPEQWWYNTPASATSSSSHNLSRDEVDRHFLRDSRMLFLPINIHTASGPDFVSICGHEGVSTMDAEMDGRRVRFYIFRRPSNNKNGNSNSTSREILVVRQEADKAIWENEAVPVFRQMMDSCLIAQQ